jgi:hypothetical protein
MLDQISAQRNIAVISLIKLQSYGVTEDEILNIHELNWFKIQAGNMIKSVLPVQLLSFQVLLKRLTRYYC